MTDNGPDEHGVWRPLLGSLGEQRQTYAKAERRARQRSMGPRLLEVVCDDTRKLLAYVDQESDRLFFLQTIGGFGVRRHFIGPDQELMEITSDQTGEFLRIDPTPFPPADVVMLCGPPNHPRRRQHTLLWSVLYDEAVKAKKRGRRRVLRLGHDTPIVGAS